MASASNTAVFLIFHRDKNGKPDRIFSYEEEEATYLLAATNICRELLNHGKGRQALKEMAKPFIRDHPRGCYEKWNRDEIAQRFIELIFDTFPWLFCDDGFPNPNVSACHHRRKYDRFFTRNQGICLNGSRVRDMCTAAKKAKESRDPNSEEHKQYRIFIFLFAITLFHELGHLFMTFLSLGERDTPDELTPKLSGIHQRTEPEAGLTLEGLVFGGSVVHARDDEYDESQPGAPHLVTETKTGQISQQTVDEFIKCNFNFPFVMSGRPISDPLRSLGKGYDPTLPSDPLDPLKWPQTRELAENRTSNPLNPPEGSSRPPVYSYSRRIPANSSYRGGEVTRQRDRGNGMKPGG